MTPILEVEDLSVALGGRKRWIGHSVPPVQAVRGVSLSVTPGEVLGIVGESGCGKTTLGRTILGLQRESGGRILLDGAEVSGLAPQAARRARNAIHYVHQDAGASLDPWWSIGRTLEEALVVQGVRDGAERRARITEVLEAVGLDAAAGRRYPHEFSGGQLRRVALARILALRPRIVVLDEPTSGLDMSVQAMVLTLLRDLQARYGLTYLFISHDLSVVRRFCDRVAIMYLGRVVELAPTAAIFAAPSHPYTRSLLAAAPRLSGRRAEAVAALQGEPPSAARLPSGCAFAPRCAMAEDRCRAIDPLPAPHGAALVACHRAAELSPAASAAAPGYATASSAAALPPSR